MSLLHNQPRPLYAKSCLSRRWLLRFTDIPVTVTAKHGETPAHVAAVQGHVESLKVSSMCKSTSKLS